MTQAAWHSAEGENAATRNRGHTRERLIRAGRRLFLDGELGSVSVDRVARAAGFTRAAFYLHFSSRDDLIAAIMLAEANKPVPEFEWFATHSRSRSSMEGFVRNVIGRAQRFPFREFHIAALQSRAAQDAYRQNRACLTDLLGETFPAFRPALDDSPGETERIARATAVVVLIEQLSVREYDMAGPALGEAMVGLIADQMIALDADYPA